MSVFGLRARVLSPHACDARRDSQPRCATEREGAREGVLLLPSAGRRAECRSACVLQDADPSAQVMSLSQIEKRMANNQVRAARGTGCHTVRHSTHALYDLVLARRRLTRTAIDAGAGQWTGACGQGAALYPGSLSPAPACAQTHTYVVPLPLLVPMPLKAAAAAATTWERCCMYVYFGVCVHGRPGKIEERATTAVFGQLFTGPPVIKIHLPNVRHGDHTAPLATQNLVEDVISIHSG